MARSGKFAVDPFYTGPVAATPDLTAYDTGQAATTPAKVNDQGQPIDANGYPIVAVDETAVQAVKDASAQQLATAAYFLAHPIQPTPAAPLKPTVAPAVGTLPVPSLPSVHVPHVTLARTGHG